MDAQKNHLDETVLLSTDNICFGSEIRKLISNYTLTWRPEVGGGGGGRGVNQNICYIISLFLLLFIERSGSVNCRVLDFRSRVAGWSLTRGTALCPYARDIILYLVLVQPRKTCPDMIEKLMTVTDIKNQNYCSLTLPIFWKCFLIFCLLLILFSTLTNLKKISQEHNQTDHWVGSLEYSKHMFWLSSKKK